MIELASAANLFSATTMFVPGRYDVSLKLICMDSSIWGCGAPLANRPNTVSGPSPRIQATDIGKIIAQAPSHEAEFGRMDFNGEQTLMLAHDVQHMERVEQIISTFVRL